MNDHDRTIGAGVKQQRVRISDEHQITLSSSMRLLVGCSLIPSSYFESTTRSTLTRIYLVVNRVTRVHGKLLTGCPCVRSPSLSRRGSSRVYVFVNTSLHCEAMTITENMCCERPEVPGAFLKSSGKMSGRGRLSVALNCLSSLIFCLEFILQHKVSSKLEHCARHVLT
jgi:hypothetical protein